MSTNKKTSPAASVEADTMPRAPQGTHTTQSTTVLPMPKADASAGSTTPLSGQSSGVAQGRNAVEGSASQRANLHSDSTDASLAGTDFRSGHMTSEAHRAPAAADQTPPTPAMDVPETRAETPGLADPFLALAADVVDDLETVRIANENRLRQLTRDQADSDGEERGFGLTLEHPDVARLSALVDMLGEAEHKAVLNLQRAMRQHPLGPWVKAQKGVGEKQAARLLASISDPYWNDLHDRPRTVSELWAYCGLHVLRTSSHRRAEAQVSIAAGSANLPVSQLQIATHGVDAGGASDRSNPGQSATDAHARGAGVAPKRQRGQKANWSTTAKTRAYLIATSCIKNGASPYRETYDQGRAKYADATHQTSCVRCGPSGKPAQPGTALSAGHQHARAMRLVMKAILRDLWVEAKRLHEEAPTRT